MNIKRNTMAALAFMIVAGSLVLPSYVSAAETAEENHKSLFDGLVQMISQKFNLDKGKVETVVTEYQTQHRQQMQKTMQQEQSERLSQLVTDGKITEEQKQAIIKKREELRNKYQPDGMMDLSPEERRTKMQEMQTEWQSWAQSQGIDTSVMMGNGHRGGMMRGSFAQ